MLLAQAEISGTFKFIREIYKLMGLSKPDLRIELPFAYPEDLNTLKVYHDYYGTQVQFDASRAAFWFDEAVLDIKIPSADAVTFAVYEAKCLAELERLQ
ncbi:AraC family transcriptional regulator, partial [Klebsiella pneumoniae]|nr:AraC family transcriptional regulator [Klebsiella pneumoniae]